jgi:hypothetical protein
MDALNSDFPAHQGGGSGYANPRGRYESTNSFYESPMAHAGADGMDHRHSIAPFGNGTSNPLNSSGGAGYNSSSYHYAGREEPLRGGDEEEAFSPGIPHNDEPWDVYADFNNTGPRYASTFGSFGGKDPAAYQQLPPGAGTPTVASRADGKSDAGDAAGGVEMVTVPAMGAEWSKEEMRAMTKRGRKDVKAERRRDKARRFWRDEEGLCGVKGLTRKALAIGFFVLAVIAAITLAFTIPRVPSFSFNDNTPLAVATGSFNESIPTRFSVSPANFSFPAYASLRVDTQSNFLPLHFNHLRATVYDLNTNRQIAEGDLTTTIPAKAFPEIQIPLNFTYVATNNTDQTWKNWHDACLNKQQYTDGKRPAVQFRLILNMAIAGLIGSRTTSTEINNAGCPFELPTNAS